MKLQNWIIGVVALAALALGLVAIARTHSTPAGSASGNDFFNQVAFYAGRTDKTSVATSSFGTAITITASEFTNWANAGVVSYSPGSTSALTFTLPASSTLRALVPNAGDRQAFCIRNATSTANVYVTFAGGLGTKLLVASSSITTVGSVVLQTGKVGCFTLIREVATSTAFDIDALYTAFQ